MRIGVPVEQPEWEHRVGLTPAAVGRLVGAGHQVVVDPGAGDGAGYPDDAYRMVGAVVGPGVWATELVVSISLPDALPATPVAVLGLLRPFEHRARMLELAALGITAFAFEAIPRITRAQPMDALSSQATAAGYQAVLEAAVASDRFFPMLTTAAGTIRPARVLVLGAGVAGLQAIATARRLGAVVSAYDVRAAAAEQVRSLGANFVELDMPAQAATSAGGYAQEMAAAEQTQILEGLAPVVAAADVVIATAAIPGGPAPRLITKEMVEAMRPGAVIVDVAASSGGNCDLTRPGESILHQGVRVMGAVGLEARVAADASQLYARNAEAFIALLTAEDGSYQPDWDDEIVAGSCITRDGRVVHPALTPSG